MVYIGRDGTISNSRPWSISRVKDLIMGFFMGIYLFFATLLGPLVADAKAATSGDKSSRGNPRGGGGGGPGTGGGGGSGRGQPAGFSRRIGRVVNMDDCNIPGGG